MADPHVLTALRRKYAELAGELRGCHARAADLENALAQVAATIRMFRADEDVDAIFPLRPYRTLKPGSGSAWVRAALDVLRTAEEPLGAHEIALRIIAAKRLAYSPALARNIRTSVRIAMKHREGVTVRREPGSPMRWSVELSDRL